LFEFPHELSELAWIIARARSRYKPEHQPDRGSGRAIGDLRHVFIKDVRQTKKDKLLQLVDADLLRSNTVIPAQAGIQYG
jgi:hypothetical protein